MRAVTSIDVASRRNWAMYRVKMARYSGAPLRPWRIGPCIGPKWPDSPAWPRLQLGWGDERSPVATRYRAAFSAVLRSFASTTCVAWSVEACSVHV
jgi:hypothetical protein